MPAKIIVSYDGTANEDDAVALGRLLGQAGGEVSLAYVNHNPESVGDTQGILNRGLSLLGDANAATHVVTDRSTPEGLAALAERENADVIVFCSDSHTAKGHVSIGNSAQRLLQGGRTAVAIAPVDFAEQAQIRRIVAVGDGDGGARQTAQTLAGALGAEVAPVAGEDTDLLVIDSRAEAQLGQVSLSSSAEHLIEIASGAVLVLPRDAQPSFGGGVHQPSAA
ncbi:MAG TPA: universal stress protein [Solirubrobacteraceae bacterium]|nr:universal stress protein [Solirubrobacteraceae bacterium]